MLKQGQLQVVVKFTGLLFGCELLLGGPAPVDGLVELVEPQRPVIRGQRLYAKAQVTVHQAEP